VEVEEHEKPKYSKEDPRRISINTTHYDRHEDTIFTKRLQTTYDKHENGPGGLVVILILDTTLFCTNTSHCFNIRK